MKLRLELSNEFTWGSRTSQEIINLIFKKTSLGVIKSKTDIIKSAAIFYLVENRI